MHILTLSILIWNNENIFTFYFIVSGSVVHWISFHLCILAHNKIYLKFLIITNYAFQERMCNARKFRVNNIPIAI